MTCPDANALARFVDGAQLVDVEAHLDDCARCTELVTELAWIIAPPRASPPGYRLVRAHADDRWLAERDGRLVSIEFGPAPAPAYPAHSDLIEIVDAGEGYIATPRCEPAFRALVWRPLVDSLARLHAAGIAVGVTPDRVVVEEERVRILPRLARRALRYVAPEVLRGGLATPRSDQFAACVMLWEALAGRPPFRGATAGALVVSAMTAPVPPAGGDRHVFAVLARGLAADPARRWADLAALRAAIDRRSIVRIVRDLFR